MRRSESSSNSGIVAIGVALLLAACSGRWSTDSARDAAIRDVIRAYLGSGNDSAVARYLEIDGKPPSRSFMAPYAGMNPPLLPVSAATHDLVKKRPLPGAGGPNVTFWVSDFDQSGEAHATIRAGYTLSDGTGPAFRLRLEREAGQWRVVRGDR